MNNYYFTFRSVTQAQNALLVLSRRGITGELVHAPIGSSENGCSYAVRVKRSDGYFAALYLHQEGLYYLKALRSTAGGVEEVVL